MGTAIPSSGAASAPFTARAESTVSKRAWSEALLVVGILVAALFFRLYALTRESLWYDETYSLWIGGMDLDSLRYLWEWPVQAPAYYLLIHYWMRVFGEGELSVRLFGALSAALAVLPTYWLGKELFGRRAGAIAALLLAVNPYYAWYSQEVRMHSWGVLFTALSVYAFWRMVNGGRWGWWALHLLGTAITFHIQYYAGLTVVAENAYVVLHLWKTKGGLFNREAWRWLRWWLLEQLALAALMLPGVIVFLIKLLDLSEWDWLSQRYGPPGLMALLNVLEAYTLGIDFPGPSWLAWGAMLLAAAAVAWGAARRWFRRQKGQMDVPAAFIWTQLALPLALCFVAGQFTTVWVTRYLLPFLPFFLILAGAGLATVPWRRVGLALVAVLCVVSLYALGNMYSVQQKEDWRGVAQYLTPQVAAQDLIVLMDEECRVPFSYYFGSGGRRVEVSRFADERALDKAVAEVQRKQQGGHLWLVVSHADSQGLERRLGALPGLTLAACADFVGIKLVEYIWL